MRIAITGASGLIGTALTNVLTASGHRVLPVSRAREKDDPPETILWNPRTGEIEADKLEGVAAVVHLAGENIFAPRWTEEKKQRLLASRVNGTTLLADTLAGLTQKPGVLVSAAGISIYGSRGSDVLTEDAPPSESGFLSLVCRQWEAATQAAEDAGIRVVKMRTSPVLTPWGGALAFMLPFFKLGLGGRVGTGDQWFSWIALDDALGGYVHALTHEELSGPVNLASPNPTTLAQFVRTLGDVLHRPTILRVPAWLVRLVSGEAAEELVLTSARVVPDRLESTGYTFQFPDLEDALHHLLDRPDSLPEPPAKDS